MTSKAVQSTSEAVQRASGTAHTTSGVVHSASDAIKTTSKAVQSKPLQTEGEYIRGKVSGLAVMVLALTVMVWHMVDAVVIQGAFGLVDLITVLFMLITAMVGGVIFYTAFQKELLARLGRWLDAFGDSVRGTSWPLQRDMLQVVGERMVELYPDDTAWFLYALLPGYMLKDLPWGLREGKYLRASSRDSGDLEEQVEGFVRMRMEEGSPLDTGDGAEIIEGEGGEIAVFLSVKQDVGLGLAVAVPQEKVWRGGAWSKRQKLTFLRKAFDQLIQRLRALQDEWDEFESMIDDEELGMIVRTLAHEIAGTLTLLLGCGGLEERGEKALARTVHLVRQLQEAPSLRTGFFTVQPREVSVKRMVNDVVQSVQRVWMDKEFLVRWDVDDSVKVVGDRNLYSVLQNLVYNALSFSEKEILIEVGPGLREDNVLIKVTDDGPGVPTKKREWIFKPLVSEGTDYRPRGKGVGLHIARRMARAVEGDVYLEKPQDGKERSNQFVIKLPVANAK